MTTNLLQERAYMALLMTMEKQSDVISSPGYERLWLWFGLSRASWLTMPRSMMHEMPDEWQDKMAELLFEWDETWDTSDLPSTTVCARIMNKFTKWPEWVLNYRRPDKKAIMARLRIGKDEQSTAARG